MTPKDKAIKAASKEAVEAFFRVYNHWLDTGEIINGGEKQ